MSLRLSLAIAASLCVPTVTAAAAAPASEARLSYSVSYLGFAIAKANLAVKLQDGLYTARLGYKTTG
ncbi:hypothetical protein J8J40_27220, partial [Mycobacterium tuberculosis]|nr:hypothetical protein [Mycobacterium tuberculosis]